jgi:hypothetical protein
VGSWVKNVPDDRCGVSREPVVITGAMEFWPALGRAAGPDRSWKDVRYLRRVAGLRTVPVEVRGGGLYPRLCAV